MVLRRADRPEETVDPAVRVVAAGSSLLIKVTGAADTPTLIPLKVGRPPWKRLARTATNCARRLATVAAIN